MNVISKVQWTEEGQDRLVWVGDDNYEYTIKSRYSVLNSQNLMQTSEVFQLLWSLKVVPSAKVCAWRLLLDRLQTRSNLVRRGVQLGNVQCPLRQYGVESAQHLFNTCKVAHKVWDHSERWVGNVTVRHESTLLHF